MRLQLFLILFPTLISCNESNNHPEKIINNSTKSQKLIVQLSYYKCEYLRNQYDTILSAGNENEINEVWGVNKSDINKLPLINPNDLDTNTIITRAEMHLKKRISNIDLQFSSFTIERINEADSLNPRNKFIVVYFLYDKRGYYQVVPILLDGRIILSKNE